MKYLILLAGLIVLFGCGNDPDTKYPVLYTLDHIDQSDIGHYLVVDMNEVSPLSANIGSFGMYKDTLKNQILEFHEIAFDLKEVELLSENEARINFFVDGVEYDTTFSYSVINDSIAIDSLEGGLISYDKEDDQFILCSVGTIALDGPNAVNPGQEYNIFNLTECLEGFSSPDYANKLLNEFDYAPLDTFGIILTHLVYK
jgi:hypothetical protein